MGHRPRAGRRTDGRLQCEEAEQVVEIEALLEDLRQRQQHPLDQIAALAERAREEGEHADGEHARRRPVPDDREIDDDGVGRVVPQGPDRREQARYQAPAHRERLVGLVELPREPVVAADQEVRQPEQLELLGGDVAGRDVAAGNRAAGARESRSRAASSPARRSASRPGGTAARPRRAGPAARGRTPPAPPTG